MLTAAKLSDDLNFGVGDIFIDRPINAIILKNR
jgi:hypothetical protein